MLVISCYIMVLFLFFGTCLFCYSYLHLLYKNMVFDYLSKQKAKLCWVDARGKKGKDIPEEIMEKGLDQLYQDIADDVLVKLAEINGVSLSDAEVE